MKNKTTKHMSKIRVLIVIGLFFFSFYGYCIDPIISTKKFHFGLTGGFSQNSSMSGDIFGGYIFTLNSTKSEANFGYTYFDNTTNFDNVKDIVYSSHGLFGEFNYYMTPKIYTGARFAINMNFVDEESQRKYEQNSIKDPPIYFNGKAILGQIGYNQKLIKNSSLRVQGQLGVHNYQMETGAVYFSNDHSPVPAQFKDKYAKELQLKLLFNLSASFLISF
jgi:hypothetical protein